MFQIVSIYAVVCFCYMCHLRSSVNYLPRIYSLNFRGKREPGKAAAAIRVGLANTGAEPNCATLWYTRNRQVGQIFAIILLIFHTWSIVPGWSPSGRDVSLRHRPRCTCRCTVSMLLTSTLGRSLSSPHSPGSAIRLPTKDCCMAFIRVILQIIIPVDRTS